jgi:PAS domain S-box-containing protein
MESRTRILTSVVSSLAVSLVIALTAFSILKGMNTELRQGPLYDDIIEKTQTLNILTASFNQGSGQSDVSQVKGILLSLDNLLKKLTSQVTGEEVLVRYLQRNNRELGPLIDQLLFSGREVTDDLERERRNILISQVWMKVRFIRDDTTRLRNMSQARMIAAQEKAGAVVIALIIILALTNGGIYFFSGRSIMRAQKALRESEERLRFALDTCHIGAWDIDLVDHTAYRSLEHDRIFGYSELLPEWTLDMFLKHALPEYRAEVETMVREATSVKTGWTHECRIRRADGEIRWIWFTGRYSTDISGRSRVAGVVQDITERKQAEEALRESMSREQERSAELATLLDAVPTPVFVTHDTECLHITGNRAADELLRNPRGAEASLSAPDEVRPRHFRALKDGRELRLDELPAQRAARGTRVEDFEFSIAFDDGATRHVLGYGTPLRDEEGRPRGAVHVLVDITERKRAEDELRASEEKFSTMLQAVPIAIALATLPDGALYNVNPAWLDLTGIARKEDAIGKTSLELGLIGDAAQRERILNEFRQNGFVRNFELAFCSRKGVQRTVLVNLDRVEICGRAFILSTMEEITERKRAEEALRNSERLYRAIGESIDYGIWVCAPDGRCTYASESFLRMVGMTQEQCSNFGWGDVLHRDDAENTISAWKECVRSEGIWDIEHRFRGADGQWYPVLARGVPVRNDRGEVIFWAGINLDISRMKRAEEALQQAKDNLEVRVSERTEELQLALEAAKTANDTMSRLVRTIAHEFRTPLGLLTGSTDILDRYWDRLSPEKRLEQNEQIQNAAYQISNLVNSVTSFQLSEKDRHATPPLLQDLRGMCRTIASEVEAAWGAGHDFIVSIAADCGCALIDEASFRRILQNLLSNAFRYTLSNGTVSLHVSRENNMLMVEITDTGIGIPKEEQAQIFEAFYRSRNVEGRRGLGLGLSIVREALSQMGGTITVTSRMGNGTTMWVKIPVDPVSIKE